MLYQAYQAHTDVMVPVRNWAGTVLRTLGQPLSGIADNAVLRNLTAAYDLIARAGLTHARPPFGLGLLLAEAANSASWLTGGADGLQGVRMWKLFGVFQLDLYGTTAYSYSLIVLFLAFLVARRLINSPFGLALLGIRENAIRMPAIGAPSPAHIRKVYTIAAVMAGIAGALLAQTTETVSLETLSFARSADVLVILILGGAGRLYGGIVGAIIYMVARDQFSGINPQYWYFWIGTLLIAVVIFLPNGVLGGMARLLPSKWSRA